MANPQPDKYTKVSNELLEAIVRHKFYPQEAQVFWCILRLTYGFHKTSDTIALSQMEKMTGVDSRQISRVIGRLSSAKRIVVWRQKGKPSKYSIQKDYNKWENSRSPLSREDRQRFLSREETPTSAERGELSSAERITKESFKETSKESVVCEL